MDLGGRVYPVPCHSQLSGWGPVIAPETEQLHKIEADWASTRTCASAACHVPALLTAARLPGAHARVPARACAPPAHVSPFRLGTSSGTSFKFFYKTLKVTRF